VHDGRLERGAAIAPFAPRDQQTAPPLAGNGRNFRVMAGRDIPLEHLYMKSLFRCLLIAAVAAHCLVACGGGSSSASTTTPTPTAAAGIKTPTAVSVVTAN